MYKKHIILFLCLFFVILSCQNRNEEKPAQTPKEKITEDEALDLLHNWTDAYLKGDAARLNNILDDTWVYSGSIDGSISDKTATITEFESADYFFDEITYQNLDVRLYGDIAVVRGLETMSILDSSKQDTTRLRLRFTDVYKKKDGEVKAIATHSSPAE